MSSNDLLRVAVSQRVVRDPASGERRDALAQEWAACFDALGIVPLLVPNTMRRCTSLLDFWRVDAILLTGGNTPCAPGVDPGDDAAPERDRTERELVRHARAKRVPLVGVCRGAQMIDLYFGGRLRPVRDARVHAGTTHRVTLASWTGSTSATVNSFHRWSLDASSLPEPLVPFVWDDDGDVEAFHHRDESIVGLMWHPERPAPHEPALADLLARALRGERFWPGSNEVAVANEMATSPRGSSPR